MKNLKRMTVLAGLIAALSGCSEKEESETGWIESAGDSVANSVQTLSEESSEAWNDLKDATYDERQEVSAYFNNMAGQAETQYEQLKDRASAYQDESAEAYDETMNELDESYDTFKAQMSELGNATQDNWQQVRQETYEAWQDLVDAMEDATNSGTSG